MTLRTFEELDCWQACRDLRRWAVNQARLLPAEERFRLTDQIIRAARSTTANIAEGYGRFHFQETMQYCRHARGSAYEVLDHLITASDEGLVSDQQLDECRVLVERAIQLINGYVRYLNTQKRVVREEPLDYGSVPTAAVPSSESTNPE